MKGVGEGAERCVRGRLRVRERCRMRVRVVVGRLGHLGRLGRLRLEGGLVDVLVRVLVIVLRERVGGCQGRSNLGGCVRGGLGRSRSRFLIKVR